MSSYHSHGCMSTDIFAPEGSNVYAIESGVSRSEYWPEGGHTVTITGDSGREFYYAHLAGPGKNGRVKAGDKIGEIGRTGSSKGKCSHLHISISEAGEKVDDFGNGSLGTFKYLKEINDENVSALISNKFSHKIHVETIFLATCIIMLLVEQAIYDNYVSNVFILTSIILSSLGLAVFSWSLTNLYVNGQDYRINQLRSTKLVSGPYVHINRPICLSLSLVIVSMILVSGAAGKTFLLLILTSYVFTAITTRRQY